LFILILLAQLSVFGIGLWKLIVDGSEWVWGSLGVSRCSLLFLTLAALALSKGEPLIKEARFVAIIGSSAAIISVVLIIAHALHLVKLHLLAQCSATIVLVYGDFLRQLRRKASVQFPTYSLPKP
jgi:hypothetical protein